MGKYINTPVLYRDGEEEKVERKVWGSILILLYYIEMERRRRLRGRCGVVLPTQPTLTKLSELAGIL